MMAPRPAEVTLELTPSARVDVINISEHIRKETDDLLAPYNRAIYCSYHTTAGYFEESLCARLNHDQAALQQFIGGFQHLFPPNADYRHDQMHLRDELSEAQKEVEPRNADSHLTYMSSGLANCVTYANRADTPVYLVELDGVNGSDRRRRRTRVLGYNEESIAYQMRLCVPVSDHRIDSVNLRDPKLGLYDQIEAVLAREGIQKGRIDVTLPYDQPHAALTVNEYETLLMQHDLADILRNPLRFMAIKGRNMLRDPRAIPSKARGYAKYDLVHLVNQFIDVLGLHESMVERVLDKFLAVPARRFLRMKRDLSLLVSDGDTGGNPTIVQGTYQSPILVQWQKAPARYIDVTFVRFD